MMKNLTEISKKQPRGKPFPKGVSGNPGGRPKRTIDEVDLIEACQTKTPEALETILQLMEESTNDRVRLSAAQYVIERGWGKAPERIELMMRKEETLLTDTDLTPLESYLRIIKGGAVNMPEKSKKLDDGSHDFPKLSKQEENQSGLAAVLTSIESDT
ncbi:MAG: hypothetical protein KZQ83_18345 [gamma proteobacterium symbiont of Taylorina sp.]|nr:hypothetical protein [gamma proteobacterium symbiont of Taylorina sp.]